MRYFGSLCSHKSTSFPITLPKSGGGNEKETYIVCLGCGKKFPYSWEKMKVVKEDVLVGEET